MEKEDAVINTMPAHTEGMGADPRGQIDQVRNYGGEWFWEDIQTPDGTEWLAEAMKNGTLTSVTDG